MPISYHEEGFDDQVLAYFGLEQPKAPDLSRWTGIVQRVRAPEGEVTIGVVGKYTSLIDSYKSLAEALTHGGIANNVKVKLDWMDSRDLRIGGRGPAISSMSTASWCRAASASAGPRARSAPRSSRASARCRISASASACRWR